MNLCIIGPKAIPYTAGIENFCTQIGKRLIKKGHNITIYVRKNYYKNINIKNIYGINLISTPGISSKNLDAITHTFTAALHALLFCNYEVIYLHGVGTSILSLLIRVFNNKVIIHTHGLDARRQKWGKFARKYLILCQYIAAKVPNVKLCVSNLEKRYYRYNYKSEFIKISTGVNIYKYVEPENIEKLYGLGKNEYILFLSRLVPEKGAHYLIDSYNKANINIKLVIAGDDPYSENYIDKLKEMSGKNNNIIFTGFVSGILLRELFSNCLLFVNPSDIEGVPNNILQALSYGKYVIASNIIGNTEAMGKFGITFRKGDVNDLSSKLKYIFKNKCIIRKNKLESIKYVRDRWSWDPITDRIENQLI